MCGGGGSVHSSPPRVSAPRVPPVVAQPTQPSKPTPLFNDDVMERKPSRKLEHKAERKEFKKLIEDFFKKVTEWLKKAPSESATPPVSAKPTVQEPPVAARPPVTSQPPVTAQPPKAVSVPPLPVAPPATKPVFDYAAV